MSDLTTYLPDLALSFTALTLALISPGPSVLAILGLSLGHGRRAGLAMASGVGFGSAALALVTVSGLSAILALSANAMVIIRILGGCYLLWLAFKAFRAAASEQDLAACPDQTPARPLLGYFSQGLAIHLTNPKALLAWLSIAALGVRPDAPFWVAAALVIGAWILSTGINGLYALVFSSKWMFARYVRARRGVQACFGAFFSYAGLHLLLNRP